MKKICVTPWVVTCSLVAAVSLFTFTPYVLQQGVSSPDFAGVPYVLWVGILIYIAILLLTIVGARVHPSIENRDREAQ